MTALLHVLRDELECAEASLGKQKTRAGGAEGDGNRRAAMLRALTKESFTHNKVKVIDGSEPVPD